MRKINRSQELTEFTEFANAHPNNDWSEIHKQAQDLYVRIKALLLKDQGGRSGYTERLLKSDSKTTHIDHFKRKSISAYKKHTYDWNNFVIDEHNSNYGADYKDKITASDLDYTLLINPIEEEAQLFFDYDEDGCMLPQRGLTDKEKRRAEYTIRVFNLNYRSLCDERKSIMSQVRNCKNGGSANFEILSWFEGSPFISAIEWELSQV